MSAADDLQARVSAALRPVNGMVLPPEVAAQVARWLADYAEYRRLRTAGVPALLLEIQRAMTEYVAADSRQREAAAQALPAEAWGPTRVDSPRLASNSLAQLRPSQLDYDFVDTETAAAMLGCSTDTVRWHCRRGNIERRRAGRRLMVSVSSIENYKARSA